MENNTLLKISFIISVLGIFLLLILANYSPKSTLNTSEINKDKINKKIQIRGQITNIKNQKTIQIITLKDATGRINIILYEKINLTENQEIIANGKINLYENQLELQTDKIEIINK